METALNEQLTLDAINAAGDNADHDWWEAAVSTLRDIARTRDCLTSDDVWESMPEHVSTPEPRAMGAVFRHGKALGWITPTPEHTTSRSPRGHMHPSRIWQSNLK